MAEEGLEALVQALGMVQALHLVNWYDRYNQYMPPLPLRFTAKHTVL